MARASLHALATAALRTRRTRSAVAIAGIAASSLDALSLIGLLAPEAVYNVRHETLELVQGA